MSNILNGALALLIILIILKLLAPQAADLAIEIAVRLLTIINDSLSQQSATAAF